MAAHLNMTGRLHEVLDVAEGFHIDHCDMVCNGLHPDCCDFCAAAEQIRAALRECGVHAYGRSGGAAGTVYVDDELNERLQLLGIDYAPDEPELRRLEQRKRDGRRIT